MKKFNFLFFIAVYLVAACSAPQVTATSEATVTLTPIPAPTLHPQFIALQESIAASGGRFTLNSDGLIYDGETPIPGVTVAPDGTMTLTVNGKEITLDPVKAVFDDEDGFSYPGYKWDATADDGAGAWVEANETVTVAGGLKIEIGEPDENGLSEVEEITLPFNLTAEEKVAKEYQMDATTFGFAPDETRLVYDKKTDTLKIVSTTNSTNIIAKWGVSDTTREAEMIYDFSKMVDENGENILFKVAAITPMLGGSPKDPAEAFKHSNLLDDEFVSPRTISIYTRDKHRSGFRIAFDILTEDHTKSVFGYLIAFDEGNIQFSDIDMSEGEFAFELGLGGKFVRVSVINFDANMRPGRVS